GGAVSFIVHSAGTSGCSLASNVLSATGSGTCTVYATKEGDTQYASAQSADATINFNVGTLSQPAAPSVSESGTSVTVNYTPDANALSTMITNYNVKNSTSVKIPDANTG